VAEHIYLLVKNIIAAAFPRPKCLANSGRSSPLGDYREHIAILELMIQPYGLARELGAFSPDQCISKQVYEVPMEMLAYRFHCASIQEHQRLLKICFASLGLEIDANESQRLIYAVF